MKRVVAVCLVVAVVGGAFYVGNRFGRFYQRYSFVYPIAKQNLVKTALLSAFGFRQSHAQFGQDLWVTLVTAPGKRDGYYVDVGSADGTFMSNTKVLDDLGWKGICIDPFPTNMQGRTCEMIRQPVFSVGGKKVVFESAGMLGGIDAAGVNREKNAGPGPKVELVTVTLDEVLAKSHAPEYIDFMSIDVEGAEYEALKGLSLDRYQIGTFAIEHNFDAKRREAIRALLESKGYVRVRAVEVEDWYVNAKIAPRIRGFLAYCAEAASGECAWR